MDKDYLLHVKRYFTVPTHIATNANPSPVVVLAGNPNRVFLVYHNLNPAGGTHRVGFFGVPGGTGFNTLFRVTPGATLTLDRKDFGLLLTYPFWCETDGGIPDTVSIYQVILNDWPL